MKTTPVRVRSRNGRRQKSVLYCFLALNFAHVMEHVFQSIQIFVLRWPRGEALGALGLLWPWLVRSEWLHYWYALVVLAGLILLRPMFLGAARTLWDLALAIQVWHHFEHALLLGQVLIDYNVFGAAVPTSVLQVFFPRVELHLAYNAAVLAPLVAAVYIWMRPSTNSAASAPGTTAARTT